MRPRGRKWVTKKEKREGAVAKMTEKFKDIMAKKGEACAKHNELKEENNVKRFNVFMKIQKKKI